MKNLNVKKLILSVMLLLAMTFVATNVYAEVGTAPVEDDLTSSINKNNTTNNTTNNVSNSNKNSDIGITSNKNTNNTAKNNTNSSAYNNTNLPKTGIEDSLPIAVLVVVGAISSVIAYRKINYYKNV